MLELYNVAPYLNFNCYNIGKFYEGHFRLLKCDHILANHPGFPGILAGIRGSSPGLLESIFQLQRFQEHSPTSTLVVTLDPKLRN